MRFSEFRSYQPKSPANVFVFVCADDFLVEESRQIWARIFGGGEWRFEKMTAKEFEEIPFARLMDDARTPSLFASSRAFIISNADKLKQGFEDLSAVRDVPKSSLKVLLVFAERKPAQSWARVFPIIEIDPLRPADIARWLVDRYKLAPEIARHLVETLGTDLSQLNSEVRKLQTYVADVRPVEARDIDLLILRSEQFGRFELNDAIFARDYKKSVQVIGAMLDEGEPPLLILSQIVRVWRQLFIGKGLAGKMGAQEVAAAVNIPSSKAGNFVRTCKSFEWKQLAAGFRELLNADLALKSSTPNAESYFDVMLWKLIA